MSAALVVAALWLTPSLLIGLWIYADRWLDASTEAERPEPRPTADPEWLRLVAAEPTPTYDALCFERWDQEMDA